MQPCGKNQIDYYFFWYYYLFEVIQLTCSIELFLLKRVMIRIIHREQ